MLYAAYREPLTPDDRTGPLASETAYGINPLSPSGFLSPTNSPELATNPGFRWYP
jgi:hypothetical protein